VKPIIFCTDMVKALLNTVPGVWPAEPIDASKPCKSQTRRVIKPIPEYDFLYPEPIDGEWFWTECDTDDDMMGWWPSYDKGLSACYQVGDILYVRETWNKMGCLKPGCKTKCELGENCPGYTYKETYIGPEIKWKPSIHMPREAARLFLEVKSVRVERLQDITFDDMRKEGTFLEKGDWSEICIWRDCVPAIESIWKKAFSRQWDSISTKRGYSWESNPWVWVYEFMRIDAHVAH